MVDRQTILASSMAHANTHICRPVKLCGLKKKKKIKISPLITQAEIIKAQLVKRCSAKELHIHSHTHCSFTVGNTPIMGTLSSITASQTGNQVAVTMSSLLISTH